MRAASSAARRAAPASQRRGDFHHFGVGAREFLLLEFTLDLESAQVAEDGARLGREAIGLELQGADALAGARRERAGLIGGRLGLRSG